MLNEPPAGAAPGDALQFDTAEPASAEHAAMTCAACSREISSVYHQAGGQIVCSGCRAQLEAPAGGSFIRAAAFGLGAGLACAAIGGFILMKTGFYIVAAIVGYFVGRAVLNGAGGRGGKRFQALAIILTYIASTGTFIPAIISELAVDELGVGVVWLGAWIGSLLLPFMMITQSPFTTVIIAISLWEAWRVTRPVEIAFTGPHPVAAPAEPAEPALA